MRQKLALLLAGLAAGAIVVRFFRRRHRAPQPDRRAPVPDPRADALRRRLAESRQEGVASPSELATLQLGIRWERTAAAFWADLASDPPTGAD